MKPTEQQLGKSRPRPRRGALGVAAVVVVLSALAAGALAHRGEQPSLRGVGASWRASAAAASRGFEISGSVRGLYPGASRKLRLVVTNRHKFAIIVRSISTAVGSRAAGCRGSNLTVTRFAGRLKVRAHSSAHTSVRVTLKSTAPDPCQGVVFRLKYSGLARKA